MLKDRFTKKFPLADYDAVYNRLINLYKADFEKAKKFETLGEALPPFSHLIEAEKVYVGACPMIMFLANNFNQDFLVGFDKEKNSFYVYKPKVVLMHQTVDEYVEASIEVMIN